MSHFPSACACIVLSCLAGPVWCADNAQAEPYPAAYFSQFQANTALEMVNHLPGFALDNGTAARGLSGTLGNVLVNGKRPGAKTDALGEVLSRIPAAGVERIDIISGAAQGIDMQGHAVVANIVLKAGDLVSGFARASSQMQADGSAQPAIEGTYSLKQQDKNVLVSLGWGNWPDVSQGHGQRSTERAGAAAPAETNFVTHGVSGSMSAKINVTQDLADGQLNWNASYRPSTYRLRAQYDADARTQANDGAAREREQGLAYTRTLGPTASVDVKALYRQSDSALDAQTNTAGDSSRFLSTTSASEQVVAGQMSWQPLPQLTIRGRFEHAVNASDSSSSWQANSAQPAAPSTPLSIEETRSESQLSTAWQASDGLNVEAGLRIERSSLTQGAESSGERVFVYPKPRLALSLAPSKALRLRLRLEREVRQLNLADITAAIAQRDKAGSAGNPELVPAKSWLSEGVLEYRFWERGLAGLTVAHAQISDVIDRVRLRGANGIVDAAGNIGDGASDSVSGQLHVPTDQWCVPKGLLKMTASWKSSRVTDPLTLTPRRQSGEQALAWNVEFSQELPAQRASWGLAFDNGWANESWQFAERDDSSGSGWAKAFLNYRPQPKTTVSIELSNLASRVISYDRTHYAPDRQSGSMDFVERNAVHTQPVAQLSLRRDF